MASERKLLAQVEVCFQLLVPATHHFQAELANSAVNLGHFETLDRGLARAHVVWDVPTVCMITCAKVATIG